MFLYQLEFWLQATVLAVASLEQGSSWKEMGTRHWWETGEPNVEHGHGPRLFWRVKEEEECKYCFVETIHQNKLAAAE